MQVIAEPRQEAKDLAKMVLCADDQSVMWFNIGGWYTDCLWMAILTLPEGDPALEQILKQISNIPGGGLYGSKGIIAQNMLRVEIAREEIAAFIGSLPMPLIALARASLHHPAAPQAPEATRPSAEDVPINFWLPWLKVVAGFSLLLFSLAWISVKRRLQILAKKGGVNWPK